MGYYNYIKLKKLITPIYSGKCIIIITSGGIRKYDTGVLWAGVNILYLYISGAYTSITQQPSHSIGCYTQDSCGLLCVSNNSVNFFS